MDYDAVANNVIMNQLCKVCGEPAAGFHFGAFTCEGCKSFFGRTYNNISSISECKNNGQCIINKKNRTACKACRLRKCLLVGMSKSGSRYGRRSNWFKIHCLLQEQQQQQQQTGSNMSTAVNLLRPHPYLSPLFRNPPINNQHSNRDNGRSSESDSGASSADPEEDLRSNSALSFLKSSASPNSDREFYATKKLPSPSSDSEFFARKKIVNTLNNAPSISPASLPSVSPSGVVPKWLPPFHGLADPSAWRELWRAPPPIAAPAPDQDQPIDLSVKSQSAVSPLSQQSDSDHELNIDVGIDEPVKPMPLDLTLDRQVADVTN